MQPHFETDVWVVSFNKQDPDYAYTAHSIASKETTFWQKTLEQVLDTEGLDDYDYPYSLCLTDEDKYPVHCVFVNGTKLTEEEFHQQYPEYYL